MKRTTILWITALLLGWCFDLLFWKQTPGINFSLFVLLCLAGGLLVLRRNGLRPAGKSLLLLIPILFFALVTTIRQEPLTLALSFVLTLGLMGLLAASYLGGRWPSYALTDYVVQCVRLAGSLIARPLIFLYGNRKAAIPVGQDDPAVVAAHPGRKRFWAILRGALIAIPILAVFAALLNSADLVFAQRLHDFTGLFRLENLPQYLFRLCYILAAAYGLAGVFLHAAQKSTDEKLFSQKPLVPQFLGFTEAAVVLGAVVVLFALFVGIQFQYFFGGGANIGLQGFSYSDYARRGFGELVAVGCCSLLLFLGLSAIVKRQTNVQRRAFSGLGIGMVALVGVMLVSAFQRLQLYEAAYGFSRLRMYTDIFMIWLGVLLAAVVLLEVLRRERLFPLAALLATIGFAATLALVNVDASIVRENVARAPQGKGLDVAYLATLSNDSVPVLAAAYEFKVLPGLTRDAVGAILVCRLHNGSQPAPGDWRSFNLSAWWADGAVAGLRNRLDLYQVTQDQGVLKILTPGSIYYECQ
jgi:hypothetical protein